MNENQQTLASLPLTADPRPAFLECADAARLVVDQVTPEHADRATSAGMTVGELIPHLVMAMRRCAMLGRGESFQSWPADAPDVTLSKASTELDTALNDVTTAWADDATLADSRPLPWDPNPLGSESLAVYVAELLLHTWDLAGGIGAEPTWSDPTATTALAVMRKQLPMADRTPIWQAVAEQFGVEASQVTAYGNAAPVDDDAPLIDQLAAWCGRDPWPGSETPKT